MPSSTNEPRAPLGFTWFLGTFGDPTTDPYLNPAPTIDTHINGSPSAGEVAITASASSLMVEPSDPDGFDVYWEEDNDDRHRHYPDYDGSVNPVDGTLQIDEALRLYDYFATPGEDVEYYARGLSDFLAIPKPPVGGSVAATLEIFTPFAWFNLDLAQLLFAWTKFHQDHKSDMDELLDRQAFQDYSEAMQTHRRRQIFNARRIVDQTIGEQAEAIIEQSFALVAFGNNPTNQKHEAALRIVDTSQIERNTRIFDTDRPEDGGDGGAGIFLTQRPQVRAADEYLVNNYKTAWGDGVRLEHIGPPYSAQLVAPFNPPAEENALRQRDNASADTFGLQTTREDRPNAVNRISGEGGYRVERDSERDRQAQFGLGPLHFDFLPGEAIHLRDTLHGLDGTEDLLVRVKTYDLDRPTAAVELLEIRDPEPTADADELDAELFLWYKADAGVTVSGSTPPDIDTWADQSGNGYNADGTGSGNPAQRIASYQNGLDVVDLTAGWLDLTANWPSQTAFPRGANWTLAVLGEWQGGAGSLSYLIDSAGLNNGGGGAAGDGFLGFHLGDPSSGSPNGPSWKDSNGQNYSTIAMPPDTRWVVLIWRPWATQANWGNHGGSRGWFEIIDLQDGTYSSAEDADPTEAHPGPLAYDKDMQHLAGDTILGNLHNIQVAPQPSLYAAEIALFRHLRGQPPLRARDLDTLVNGWRAKWAL